MAITTTTIDCMKGFDKNDVGELRILCKKVVLD
jgi:hypothetical protein